MGASSPRAITVTGRTVSHYRIVSELGSGGMGIVYRADDLKLGRAVALKFISAELAHEEQAIRRLRAEARAASALNHPNICTIYDIDEDEDGPFIVMELMKGLSLRDRLTSGPLKAHQVVDIGIDCADALHAAHQAGIVHRDIKPANVFLTDNGHVKLLDFGVAKLASGYVGNTATGEAPHSTVAGISVGTVAYMSPEQATGEDLDGRTDLFSLGVVLYECATGRHPFPGKTSGAVLAAIINQSPPSPVALNPELPLRLQEVINNCLEKDRELRYQSSADLRADLRRVRRDLQSGPSHAVAPRRQSAPVVVTAPDVRTALVESGPQASDVRSRPIARWTLVAGGAIVVAALAIAVFYATQPRPRTVVATTPQPLPDPAIQARLTLALASLQKHDYRAALTYAGEVLTLDPAQIEAAKIRDEARVALSRLDADAARPSEGASPPSTRSRGTAEVAAPAPRTQVPPPSSPPAVPSAAPPKPERTEPVPPEPQQPPVVSPETSVPAAPARTAPPQQLPLLEPAPPKTAAAPASAPPAVEPSRTQTPPAPAASEDDAIRNVVMAYARAIERKDLALFRSIKPNLSREEERRLQESFRAVTSQRVSVTIVAIEHRGDEASVLLRRRDVIQAGAQQQTAERQQTLTLARSGNGWVISAIR